MELTSIYLFTGPETFLIDNKIKRIVLESGADEFNISRYDEEETGIGEAIRDAATPPFMAERKVVIIKNPLFLTSEKNLELLENSAFLNYLNHPLNSTVLIINAGNLKLDERKEVVKQLKKTAHVEEVRPLSEIEITGWVKRQCTLNSVAIKDDAIKIFLRLAGSNLQNAKNELDKLINYVGPSGTISADIVRRVVVKEIYNDVYALTNSILDQDKAKIINIYNELLASGNDVHYLFSLVAKSLRETLLARIMLESGYTQADIAKKMNISSGRAYYLVKNARAVDLEKIKRNMKKLGDLDFRIKSGQIDIKSGFEFFLFGL